MAAEVKGKARRGFQNCWTEKGVVGVFRPMLEKRGRKKWHGDIWIVQGGEDPVSDYAGSFCFRFGEERESSWDGGG